jgi:hypothetical protein
MWSQSKLFPHSHTYTDALRLLFFDTSSFVCTCKYNKYYILEQKNLSLPMWDVNVNAHTVESVCRDPDNLSRLASVLVLSTLHLIRNLGRHEFKSPL